MTKERIEQGGLSTLTVVVDNAAAKENVSRFMRTKGFEVQVEENSGEFHVSGSRDETTASEIFVPEPDSAAELKHLVMVGTEFVGRGDDELGQKLMASFIATLKEMGDTLWRLVLVNGGVKLAIEGSEQLEQLKELEKEGTTILVCGTCLNHFNLLEKKKVGETTNMLDIVTAMQLADKVISLT
jgi:selenium metabolism protein YedF